MLAVNFFIWFMALCWISGFDKIESQRGGAFGRVFLLLVTSMPHMKKGYAQGRDLYNRIERLQQDLVAPLRKSISGGASSILVPFPVPSGNDNCPVT